MIFFFCLCGFFFLWFLCYYHWDFGSSKHLWLYAKYGNHWKTFSCSCILLNLNYCDGLELCLNSLLPRVLRQYSCGIYSKCLSTDTQWSWNISYECRQLLVFEDITSRRWLGTWYLNLSFRLPRELALYLQLM